MKELKEIKSTLSKDYVGAKKVQELVEAMGKSKWTVYWWRKEGKVRGVKIGGRLYLRKDDVAKNVRAWDKDSQRVEKLVQRYLEKVSDES